MEVGAFDGWNALSEVILSQDDSSVHVGPFTVSRDQGNSESCMWLNIRTQLPFYQLTMHSVQIKSNARFIELYYSDGVALKYVTTIRGGTLNDRYVFEADFHQQIKFSQLAFKFLSIKKHSPVDFSADCLELKLDSLEVLLKCGISPSNNMHSNSSSASQAAIYNASTSGARTDSIAQQTGSTLANVAPCDDSLNDPPSTTTENDCNSSSSSSSNTITADTVPKVSAATATATPATATPAGRPKGGRERMDIREMLLQEMNKMKDSEEVQKRSAAGAGAGGVHNSGGGVGGGNENNAAAAALYAQYQMMQQLNRPLGQSQASPQAQPPHGMPGAVPHSSSNSSGGSGMSSNSQRPSGSNGIPHYLQQKQQPSAPSPPFTPDAGMLQLMYQMKTSMLADFSSILDAKLAPVIRRLDRMERSVGKMAEVLNAAEVS